MNQLVEERDKLSGQLHEVIKMNSHWQRYDSQREEYVLKLTKTNQDMNKRNSDLEQQLLQRSTCSACNNGSSKADDGSNHTNRESDANDDRPKQLQGSLESTFQNQKEQVSSLKRHIHELQERIKELEKNNTGQSRRLHKEDELAILREQVNVCVEDFKQERRDRERIHAENSRLKERLAQAETQIMSNEEQVYISYNVGNCVFQAQISLFPYTENYRRILKRVLKPSLVIIIMCQALLPVTMMNILKEPLDLHDVFIT